MRTILKRVPLPKGQMIGLLILILVSSLAEMLLPTMLANMIDQGIGKSSEGMILVLAVIMLVLAVIACVATVISTRISAKIAAGFAADARKCVFEKIQTLSAANIDHFGTASLITRTTSDITNIQMFLSLMLRMGVMAPLMAVAGLVLSSATGGKVSSVLNIAIPVLMIAVGIVVVFSSRYSASLRKKLDEMNRIFLENLEGVRVIRAFNKQAFEKNRFQGVNGNYTEISIKAGKINALINPVIQVIFGIAIAAVLGIGAIYVSDGTMQVGALVANSQYITMILMSVMLFAVVIIMLPMTYACAKRVEEVLLTENSMKDGTEDVKASALQGDIVFENVTFSYPNSDEPVLDNISFTAHRGETVAIIGRTGCGKSSILKLIARIYDTTAGHIYINGKNIKKCQMGSLRDIIGYVPQKNLLFRGDIASNLNFGNENGTLADWQEASRIACAEEFIEKKENTYHSEIAQGGTNLSGGQRQRMAIARAVMKKPQIYLLDDSFSALDMKTDRQLRENLKEKAKGATLIVAAQRISSIMDADRILVLEDGKLIGNGTHRELLASCQLYREIAVLQLGEEALYET